MNKTTLEMTSRLQGGMKEDEMITSARSTEERNTRRKHSEIGETQISDDPEYTKREISIAFRRSEELVETPLQKCQTNTMEKMQLMTKQTNEKILQSVGSQLQGMTTTIEKCKYRMETIAEEWTKKSTQWNKG